MSQEIVRAKQWNQKTRVRSGMVVIFEDAYFLSDSGVNSQPTNGYDWIFLGTVEEMNGGSGNIKSFPTKDDFPVPGEESTIYLDLSTDLGYVWDFETEAYKGIGVDEARLIAIELKNAQQDLAIAGKMPKPAMAGFYFINQTGDVNNSTSFVPINPNSYFLTYWNGSSFQSSSIKQNSTNIELINPMILKKVTNDEMVNLPSPVEGMIVYRTNLTKGIFKYESGSWSPIGLNLGNSDLSNSSARTFAQGNSFTWNTAGFGYFWKGLADKTGQAAYSKSLIIHPTTGETVTRDFADPAATTLAVQNANTTQKTAMRTALLGTATPANPVLQDCAPRFITRGEVYIDMYGINLTLLDPVFIWIERVDGTKIYATNFFNLTPTAFTTVWNIPSDLPNGDYDVKIQNGVTAQGLSTAKMTLINSISQINLTANDWKRKLRLLSNGTEVSNGGSNTSLENYVRLNNNTVPNYEPSNPDSYPAVIYKSQNLFPGNKDFSIDITILEIGGSGSQDNLLSFPYIGLTQTTHDQFVNILSLIYNHNIYEALRTISLRYFAMGIDIRANANTLKLSINKVGNKVFYRLNTLNYGAFQYYSETIDTSKDYALFLRHSWHTNNNSETIDHTINAKIIN